MFGGVPIVTTTDIQLKARSTRRELFDFIESELIAARDGGLPATWAQRTTGGSPRAPQMPSSPTCT